MKQYVTQAQIEEAVKTSLEMAKDTKLDAKERGNALGRVFKAYHANVGDHLNEKLLDMHEDDHNDVKDTANKAIKAASRNYPSGIGPSGSKTMTTKTNGGVVERERDRKGAKGFGVPAGPAATEHSITTAGR